MRRISYRFAIALAAVAAGGILFQAIKAADVFELQEPISSFNVRDRLPVEIRPESGVHVVSFTASSAGLFYLVRANWPNALGGGGLALLHTDFDGNLVKALDAPNTAAEFAMLDADESGRVYLADHRSAGSGISGGLQVWGAAGLELHVPIARRVQAFCVSQTHAVVVYSDGAIEGLLMEDSSRRRSLGSLPGVDQNSLWMVNMHCYDDRFIVVDQRSGAVFEGSWRYGVTRQTQPTSEAFVTSRERVEAGLAAVKASPESQLMPVSHTSALTPDGASLLLGLNRSRLTSEGFPIIVLSLANSSERVLRFAMPSMGDAPEGADPRRMTMAPHFIASAPGRLFIADRRGLVASYQFR